VTLDRIKKTNLNLTETAKLISKITKNNAGEFNDLQVGMDEKYGIFVAGKIKSKDFKFYSPTLFIMTPTTYREYDPIRQTQVNFPAPTYYPENRERSDLPAFNYYTKNTGPSFKIKHKLLKDLFNNGEKIVEYETFMWPRFNEWKSRYSPSVKEIKSKSKPKPVDI
jgi:hypothetical protein